MRITRRHSLTLFTAAALAPRVALAAAPLKIVATTGMIADAARVIGGDLVEVQALMGPGVDPHSYRQTRSDIVAMTRADLVLWHGLYLEAQMEAFFEKLSARRTVMAVAQEAMPQAQLLGHADYDGRFDPHVWMVPDMWALVCARIADALIAIRPEATTDIHARLTAYQARLSDLSAYATQMLASVPEPSRVLLSAHDAFGYFGREYGFEVLGIQGISTESEAGLNRISTLVDLLVSRKIGAVFVESSVSDRNIRAVIEGAAAQGHDVQIGGELYSDAMGEPGTYTGTYLGMIDHNATTITRALGGTAPDHGWQGKLDLEG